MFVSDLYRNLSFGYLSNLSVGLEGAGDLTELGKKQATKHLNDVLRDLSGRFPLVEDSMPVNMQEGMTTYEMIPENSFTYQKDWDLADQTWFIEDDIGKPFQGRVAKILSVFIDAGKELVLNELDNPDSVHTSGHSFVVPYNWPGALLAVHYQSYVAEIAEDAPDTIIPVPVSLETAIELYVAARFFSNMTGPGHAAKGVELMQQYEIECLKVENKDLLGVSGIATLPKFNQRGFA